MSDVVQVLNCLVFGNVFLLAINFLGKVIVENLRLKIDNSETEILSVLFFGYLSLSIVSIIYICGINTIFLPILVLLVLFYLLNKSEKKAIKFLTYKTIFFQAGFFSLFCFYRFISVYDFDSNNFYYFFMDDYSYMNNINSIVLFGEENNFSEVINKDFGYDYYYSIYHYYTFSLAVLIKKISGINTFFIYNFYLIPFFQTLAFLGLYFTSIVLTKKTLTSLIISLLCLTSLRYNVIHVLVSVLPQEIFLKKSIVLKSYYGFQFLNSGFGLKFCISIFLLAFFFNVINRKEFIPLSSLLIYINPLLFFPFVIIQLYGIFCNNSKRSFLYSIIFFIPLFVFIVLQDFRGGYSISEEVIGNIEVVLGTPIKQQFFIIVGRFFNDFYGVLFLPLLLMVVLGRKTSSRVISFLILTYPFIESLGSIRLLNYLYFGLLLVMFSFFLYYNRKNRIILFFVFCSISVFWLEVFNQVMPNFNQIFLLFLYPAVILFSCHLLSRLIFSRFYFGYFFLMLFFSFFNLFLNVRENFARRIPIFPDVSYKEKVRVSVDNRNRCYSGIFDSRMKSIVFANQYFYGVELQWFNDQIFPVFLTLPSFSVDSSVIQINAKMNNPIWSFTKGLAFNLSQDEIAFRFCKKFNVKYLVIKEYDFESLPKTRSLFSRSINNSLNKYSIHYN